MKSLQSISSFYGITYKQKNPQGCEEVQGTYSELLPKKNDDSNIRMTMRMPKPWTITFVFWERVGEALFLE
jgi:hypothetical protein